MYDFKSILSVLVICILLVPSQSIFAQQNREDVTELKTNFEQDLKEISNYMNKNASESELNKINTYNVKTSSGNEYKITTSLEEIPKMSMFSSASGSDQYEVEEGKSYRFTYTQEELSGRTGSFTAKVYYTVDEISSTGMVTELIGTDTSISASPVQGYTIQEKELYFSNDSGAVLSVSGHITMKSSTTLYIYLNYYPKISIFGAGNSENCKNKVMVLYSFSV